MIHEAEFRHRFSERATRDAMHRANGRRNLKRLEKALELHAAGSAGLKSRDEAAFLSMLKDLPEPLVNTKLHGIEVDFHWPAYKLVVEVDGPGHGRPRTQRDDARKEAALRERPATRSVTRRQRSASRSSGTSVTNMCPGACVIISSGRLAAATACGVTPHAQNTGTSPSRISTGSPYCGEASDAIPSTDGSPTCTGAPCTDG